MNSKLLSKVGIKTVVGLSILLFVLITLFTGQYHSVSDGFNIYGFPFTFYQTTSGKCGECNLANWFDKLYFIIDLVLCFLLTWLIVKLIKYSRTI